MSTYYQYEDVKLMIAHKLMSMEGWKIYGYKEDESDSMTDYYSPASWDGVAEKNGYVLCVDVYGEAKEEEIRVYNNDQCIMNKSTKDKIAKLEQITIERGASQSEEETAKAAIKKLMEKASITEQKSYTVVGKIPAHMANPPRMNWHIEKDGIYIAKGNGILKFSTIDKYYRYGGKYMEDMQSFIKDKEKWADEWVECNVLHNYYSSEDKAREAVKSRINDMEEDYKLMEEFNKFIHKIDTTCGGLLGEGNGTIYEKVTVTEYKTEIKPVETEIGSIKEGQCFILKSHFSYGCRKGLVYRIHATEYNGKITYHANKLNGKLTKECTGNASRNNYWYIGADEHDNNFTKWIAQGCIAWCELKEVKTPYEVEKVVKKTIKANNDTMNDTNNDTVNTNADVTNYTFTMIEDTDTRDGSKIYLVKVAEKLSREEYTQVNQYIKSLGGYYSKFKHAFIFKDNPNGKLNISTETENKADVTEEQPTDQQIIKDSEEQPEATKKIAYTIEESTHTKTGDKIWIVKPEKALNKIDFSEIRQKLATLQGYYSSYVRGFIFKYDPTEKLKAG